MLRSHTVIKARVRKCITMATEQSTVMQASASGSSDCKPLALAEQACIPSYREETEAQRSSGSCTSSHDL
jgi:hypothetical protein